MLKGLDIKERTSHQSQIYLKSVKDRLESGSESPKSKELYQEIKKSEEQCKYLADEKIDIIDQIAKQIDSHLALLDKHIARFQEEVKESESKPKPVYEEPLVETSTINLAVKRKGQKPEAGGLKRHKKMPDESSIVKIDTGMNSTMPDGAAGQIYCKCQKLIYDQMVACDNPKCKYNWFHFSCVGLKAEPGKHEKWYCSDCSLKLPNKHK